MLALPKISAQCKIGCRIIRSAGIYGTYIRTYICMLGMPRYKNFCLMCHGELCHDMSYVHMLRQTIFGFATLFMHIISVIYINVKHVCFSL